MPPASTQTSGCSTCTMFARPCASMRARGRQVLFVAEAGITVAEEISQIPDLMREKLGQRSAA